MASVQRVAGLVASWSRQARAFSSAAEALKPAQTVVAQAVAAQEASSGSPSKALRDLSDAELVHLIKSGLVSPHRLEADLGDASRAVAVRRAFVAETLHRASSQTRTSSAPHAAMSSLPIHTFDTDAFYQSILNTNCEAVIGYVPLPVGIVGPLLLDGKPYYVPLATTEGALVASTNRGCAAIRRAGGATTVLHANGMTRAPLVRVNSLAEAAALKAWLENPQNYAQVAAAFNSTSRFGRLQSITAATAGRNVYLRFKAFTGDAMGMNMITKGVNEALKLLHTHFPSMRVLSLSGNVCTDKKPSAINWIEGRGKSVAAEVRLSGHVLKTVLKTTADAMTELNTAKNLVGSALAGSIGGFNAHASNIVTAVYLATGQDPAQNVESSTCLTLMEKDASITDPADPEGKAGEGIVMTVTMPSVEVGTVGGGTSLPAQAACLELLGLKGSLPDQPGANAAQLSRVVAGAVLAGELSLMSALTTNDLLSSHMKLNRKHGDDGAKSASGAFVTAAMLTKLSELQGHANVEAVAQRPEGGASSSHPSASLYGIAGSVPGGAPAGSHPHPLHMGGAAAVSNNSHPGRRYFAAPTTRMSRFGGHVGASAAPVAGRATATIANAYFAASSISAGVCEETRGVQAAANKLHGWDEPMLSIP